MISNLSQFLASVAGVLVLALNVSASEVLDPTKPDRGNDEWRMRHAERVADVRAHADKLDVLFIGDSITGGWLNIGKAVWEKEFVPLRAVNIGIAGSQTSRILWQFENGAIDGIRPRTAVLMIGVNNVVASPSQSAREIARGISAIVARLREKLPNTRILLLGTFPKDRAPNTPDRHKIQELNSIIAHLNDGQWIRFLDIGGELLDKDGNLNAEVSPDGVHLTEAGYQKWAKTIIVKLSESLAGDFLTPESLAMPRRQIALKGIDLRLINARGAVSFREKTVTGIDSLWIAPRAASRVPAAFNLSFREETLGALIEDNQDEWRDNPLCVWQNWNQALDNRALGIWKNWSNALMLPFQGATWAPDAYTRRGTFHHYLGKDLISFGVVSRTVPAADVDGAYQELTITNRTDRPLSLTLIPDQPLGDRVAVPSGGEGMPAPVEPAWENKRSARFSRREGGFSLQALSDIGPSQGDGWRLDLPARGQRIVHVALLVADAGAAEPAGHYAADLAARFAASRQTTVDLLRRAAEQLPRIETGNPRLDEFYQRSILSVLFCRRDRADSPIRPFYDIVFGDGNSVTWDVSFSASLLAMYAPDEAKRMLTAFLSAGGVMNSTWLSAKDGRAGSFYMQSPFALLEIAQRYMRQSGDRSLLEEKAGAKTVFEHFRDGGQTLLDSYVKDGLIDAGSGTGKMLEIRTSGYEHTVAAINGMAVDYLQQVADWCRDRGDAKAEVFQAAARRLHDEIERRLWDESSGWYINLYPDGSRHRVMSYHVFDLLRQPSMPEAHRRRLAEHIVPGEFLGPYGMYSIALSDEEHWDMEDCDWGGGGQYVGQPLSIAESLYRMEEPERAWDVLSRCLLWVDRFPYFPQTIYTDELALEDHCRGWSLQVSAGAGAQAIIHGVFGLMPQDDGSLVVRPHYNKSLDTATLNGYRFRNHLYDLRMDAKTFQVVRDGVPLAEERHGKSITITEQGEVRKDTSGSGMETER
jgi:lysophospholipase L1-like esterase